MNTPPQRDTLAPRQPKGLGLGLLLALIVHGLLVLALALSVRWRASEPEGVVAELWSAVPQFAAPQAVTPPPPPPAEAPAPKREPVRPQPAPEPPPPPPPLPDPKIAIEQAKKQAAKDEAKEAAKEAAQQAKLARREEAKLEEAKRKEAERVEALEKKKADAAAQDRKKRELAEQQRADDEKLAASREANLKRMLGQANASTATATATATTASGTAAQDSGPSAGYAGRIKAAIKPNIVYPDSSNDANPLATVEVKAAPDGTILSSKLIKSSGVKRWDDAVLSAVNKTEKMPRDIDGRVPPVFELNFRPND